MRFASLPAQFNAETVTYHHCELAEPAFECGNYATHDQGYLDKRFDRSFDIRLRDGARCEVSYGAAG